MKKTVSATEARVHFGELIRSVADEGAIYLVERIGKPQAVVISAEEYERLTNHDRKVDLVAMMHEARKVFAPLIESGKLDDLEEVVREEREKRSDHLADLLR